MVIFIIFDILKYTSILSCLVVLFLLLLNSIILENGKRSRHRMPFWLLSMWFWQPFVFFLNIQRIHIYWLGNQMIICWWLFLFILHKLGAHKLVDFKIAIFFILSYGIISIMIFGLCVQARDSSVWAIRFGKRIKCNYERWREKKYSKIWNYKDAIGL